MSVTQVMALQSGLLQNIESNSNKNNVFSTYGLGSIGGRTINAQRDVIKFTKDKRPVSGHTMMRRLGSRQADKRMRFMKSETRNFVVGGRLPMGSEVG